MSMKKIGLFALRLFVGLAFAFVWSAFCILTGIKQSYFAIYGYVVGFFAFGMWLSKRWVGTKPGLKYDDETWPVQRREQIVKEDFSSSKEKQIPKTYLDRLREYPEFKPLAAQAAQPVKSEHKEAVQPSKSGLLFMNQKQKIILIATAALIVILVLFPPFQMEYPTRMVMNLGYGFLLSARNLCWIRFKGKRKHRTVIG